MEIQIQIFLNIYYVPTKVLCSLDEVRDVILNDILRLDPSPVISHALLNRFMLYNNVKNGLV